MKRINYIIFLFTLHQANTFNVMSKCCEDVDLYAVVGDNEVVKIVDVLVFDEDVGDYVNVTCEGN